MILVQVPPDVQEGHVVQVVDPNTNQPFQVQVPAGLQPGQTFNCALPTTPVCAQPQQLGLPQQPQQPAPALPATLNNWPAGGSLLKERLANAGGRLRVGLAQTVNNTEIMVPVSKPSGEAVCVICCKWDGATLSLPDGSDGQAMTQRVSEFGLTGTRSPGGTDFAVDGAIARCPCTLWGCRPAAIAEVTEGDKCVVGLVVPARPSLCPYNLLCCVLCPISCIIPCISMIKPCCSSDPTYIIQLRGEKHGEVCTVTGDPDPRWPMPHSYVDEDHSCASVRHCVRADELTLDIIAEDPEAMHGALLCLTELYREGEFCRGDY